MRRRLRALDVQVRFLRRGSDILRDLVHGTLLVGGRVGASVGGER